MSELTDVEVLLDGRRVTGVDATVSVSVADEGLLRGDGVFEVSLQSVDRQA